MKKKIVSVLLCVAMFTMILTGCGGGKKVSSAAGGGSNSDTVVYWSMWSKDEPQAKVIAAAAKKFEEKTKIKVDVQFKGRNGQREGLEPALAAKRQIDVFDEAADGINKTWGKYTMNLEDLAKEYVAQHANAKLIEIARDAYAEAHNGDTSLHSIPYQAAMFGFFYNGDLFKKAGIAEEPKTWEELDADCQKLKSAGITPITGDDAYMPAWMGLHFARFIGQDGVKSLLFGKEVNGQQVKWSDPRVLNAAKCIEDFAKKGYFSKNITTNSFPAGQNQEFAPGEAAIVLDGTWLPNEVKTIAAKDFNWGYFNYPSVPNGVDDYTASCITPEVFAINKDSKHAKEAFQFIEYVTTGEVDEQLVTDALSIPTDVKNGQNWPKQIESVKEDFDATTKYYGPAAGAEENNDMTPDIKDNMLKLIGGKITAEKFVSNMKSVSEEQNQ